MKLLYLLGLSISLSEIVSPIQEIIICDKSHLGDKICNPECDNEENNWDNQDCENNHCFCEPHKLGDGFCNWECVNFACGWDGGDCCENWMLYDGYCDSACYVERFKYDNGDCKTELGTCKCPDSSIGDDDCNFHCSDHPECLNEMGDCCFKFEIGDGHCEEYCYTATTDWDGGDCFVNPPRNCPCWERGILGNGICDPECDTEACVHDFGDCCNPKLLGNGVCDPSCDTEFLDYDGHDCAHISIGEIIN